MRRCLFAFLVLSFTFATPLFAQTCGQAGTFGVPAIAVTDDTLGNFANFEVSNALPGAPWVWIADAFAGPTVLPFGTLCTSSAPLILFDAVTGGAPPIGPAGSVAVPYYLPPALSGLAGVPFAMQAVVVDPGAPFSVAISNGLSYSVRTPHLYLSAPGVVNPFGGSTPGAVGAHDAITGLNVFGVSTSTQLTDLIRVPASRRLFALQSNGAIVGLDETTGAQVFSTTPVTTLTGAKELVVTPDGSAVLVIYQGVSPSPFGGGSPGGVVTVDLFNGQTLTTIPLASGNPSTALAIPGTTKAYLRAGSDIIPIDYATATVFPAIPLGAAFGSIADWVLGGGTLAVLSAGTAASPFGGGTPGAINAVDLSTDQLLLPTSVTLPGSGGYTSLRFGPGSIGSAFFALNSSQAVIHQISPASLAVTQTIPISTSVVSMTLSQGATEWLLLRSGQAPSPFGGGTAGNLIVMNPATLALTTVATLPTGQQTLLTVVESDTLRQGYILSGGTTIVPFTTDPTLGVGVPFSPPITGANAGFAQ